jgi:hypothetical protein
MAGWEKDSERVKRREGGRKVGDAGGVNDGRNREGREEGIETGRVKVNKEVVR